MIKSIDAQIKDINNELNSLVGKTDQARESALKKLGYWARDRFVELCQKRFHTKPRTSVRLVKNYDIQKVQLYVNMRGIYVKILKDAYQDSRGVHFDGEFYPHAFIANIGEYYMPRVYRRLTKKRFPLERIYVRIGAFKEKVLLELSADLLSEFSKYFGAELGNNTQLYMDDGHNNMF